MKKIGENKKLILVVVIVALLVLGCVIFMKNIGNSEENNKEKITYKISKTEKIGSTISHYDEVGSFIEDKNGDLYLTYPTILGDSKDILNINNTIKNNINDNINDLNNTTSLPEEYKNSCYWAKMEKTGKIIGYESFPYLDYEVIENDKYISIIERNILYSECATGSSIIKNIYIINKNNGKSVDKNNIVNEDLLTSFIKKTENNMEKDSINDSIKNKDYHVFYSKSGNIVMCIPSSINGYIAYEYVDNNWIEYSLN